MKAGLNTDRKNRALTQLLANSTESIEKVRVLDTQNLIRNHYKQAARDDQNLLVKQEVLVIHGDNNNEYGKWESIRIASSYSSYCA